MAKKDSKTLDNNINPNQTNLTRTLCEATTGEDAMTTRITDRDLKATIDRLNRLTNQPAEPYTRDVQTGKLTANIGNYHLSGAYGGVCVHQMVNEGGGVRTPICSGYTTKRDLYNQLQAYIRGIEVAGEKQ